MYIVHCTIGTKQSSDIQQEKYFRISKSCKIQYIIFYSSHRSKVIQLRITTIWRLKEYNLHITVQCTLYNHPKENSLCVTIIRRNTVCVLQPFKGIQFVHYNHPKKYSLRITTHPKEYSLPIKTNLRNTFCALQPSERIQFRYCITTIRRNTVCAL